MTIARLLAASGLASLLALAGCAGPPTNQQLGIGAGAVIGGVAGNAVSNGSALGTVGGAAAGALIGNEIGRRSDESNRGYYPNNGPRY